MLQAVFRKARALGIVRVIENNRGGQDLLRKYYALALLPAEKIVDILPTLQQVYNPTLNCMYNYTYFNIVLIILLYNFIIFIGRRIGKIVYRPAQLH